MVYQEFALASHLSIAENLYMGREPGRFGFVNRRAESQEARSLLERVGLRTDPDRVVMGLTVAEMQRVEIAKALAIDAKVVIMDEPTATLAEREIEGLFEVIRDRVTVVNIDSGTDPQPPDVPVFATDNVAAAEQVPDLIARELGEEGGEVAFIPFQQGTLTNEQREEGFKKGLKQHPELELVAEQSSQSDYNKALQVTEDILTANPDLDAIFAANEPGVLGAAEAVRQAGKAGDVVIIGWDASPEEIQGVRDGVISALIVQNPFKMGYDGTNAAIKIIREGAKVESEDTGSTVVTRDNLDDPEVQSVLNPSCENPPV
jgi:DNA-binding LacI/PurR family transcriptional regulator